MRAVNCLVLGLALAACPAFAATPKVLHHDLEVRLDPSDHRIDVRDVVSLPAALLDEPGGEARFVIHAGLQPVSVSKGFELEALPGEPDRDRYGINEDSPGETRVPLREYRLRPVSGTWPPAAPPTLFYGGKIHHPLVAEGEEYARSFSRTPGIIGEEGVVLSGGTWWLPAFGERLLTFRLAVDLPEGWDAVSQGKRVLHELAEGGRRVIWDSAHPGDEAYLIAGRFTEYSRQAGEVTAFAFLREPDPGLAAKYLEATAQYVEMYRKLLGPYPYAKFALVENFWDTGYGMPSFTLLGPKIIRFPFILHSSYPHEILHNWWGNSVFVDFESGNWCEGLTAYLADHLIKEGQGRGAEYRRDTLKKYRSYVRGEQDFPLSAFRSRHSSATEAVGYGKSLMLWHMLRRRLGEEKFVEGLQRFYLDNRFRRASFSDLEAAFSSVSGSELEPLFRQWVDRTGAPQLELASVSARKAEGDLTTVSIEIRQVQGGEPYSLSVPVSVTLPGEPEARVLTLELDGASGTLETELPSEPRRVDVDPGFDLFRRLDPNEIPPSFGQLFGAERVSIVLPKPGEGAGAPDWRAIAEGWAEGGSGGVEIVNEDEIESLPADRAVWVLGSGNRWAGDVVSALASFNAGADEDVIRFGETEVPREDHCFAFAVRNPLDPDLAIGWLGADRAAALTGLARKLPHYGKYSYLAFSGDEPTNVAKGQWPVLDSPLVWTSGGEATAPAALPPGEPLARLEPVFDPGRLLAHVRYLSSGDLAGRGIGTPGLERAATYVAQSFQRAGLEPGGDDGTYFQTWSERGGPDGREVVLRNVIGVLPGANEELKEQSVVVGAHVDHLGLGWPDAREGAEGKLHPGADDNASGVAVLLELAALLGRELKPQRSIVFVAFDGEEWGLRGSKRYVETMRRWPAGRAIAMINLDTVGRLEGKKITLFGTGSATEWIHIAMGIGFTTGVEATPVADDLGGSDQKSFLEKGVPSVQVFSEAHEDYHRPTDTADLIDADGLVKIATFVREAVVYLGEREGPLTSTLAASGAGEQAARPAGSGRRVSLGTLPEFTFPGPGVKVARVLEGTPAERAGLLAGDLILAIDDREIANVREYSDVLKARSPRDTIRIRVLREGEQLALEATLVAR